MADRVTAWRGGPVAAQSNSRGYDHAGLFGASSGLRRTGLFTASRPAVEDRSWRPGGGAVSAHPSNERMGAVTDFFLGGSLPRCHRLVPLSDRRADELDRLVNWRKSLGPQLEINETGAPSALVPP
jgi:hypothetical protein